MPLPNVGSFRTPVDDMSGGGSYVDTIRPDEIFKDRRVLNDIEQHYFSQGDTFDSEEKMIRQWFEDMRWQEANSFSAIKAYAESTEASEEEKQRLNRLTRLWQRVPDFAPEGGGVGNALATYGIAALGDPVNLIPLPGVNKGLGVAAAQAAKQGANLATRGALHGAKRNAIAEGIAGATSEGIIGVAQEAKEEEIGHSEFSLANVLGRVALGGVAGGVLGGGIGAVTGAANAPKAAAQALGMEPGGGTLIPGQARRDLMGGIDTEVARQADVEARALAEREAAEAAKLAPDAPAEEPHPLAMRTELRAEERAKELRAVVQRRNQVNEEIRALTDEVNSARDNGLGHEMYAHNEAQLENYRAEVKIHDQLDVIDRTLETAKAPEEVERLRRQRAELFELAQLADGDPEFATAQRLADLEQKWSTPKADEVTTGPVTAEAQTAPAEQPAPAQPVAREAGQEAEGQAAGNAPGEEVTPAPELSQEAVLEVVAAANPDMAPEASARLGEVLAADQEFARHIGAMEQQPKLQQVADVDRAYAEYLSANTPEVEPRATTQETVAAEVEAQAQTMREAPEPEQAPQVPKFKTPKAQEAFDELTANGEITPADYERIAPNGTVDVRKMRSVARQNRTAKKQAIDAEVNARQAVQQAQAKAAKTKADAAKAVAANSEKQLGAVPEQIDARVADQANAALHSNSARGLIARIPDEAGRKRVHSAVIKAARMANGEMPGGTDGLLRELKLFNESVLADMSDEERLAVNAMADMFGGEREVSLARANIIHMTGSVDVKAVTDGPIGADGIYKTWDDLYRNLPPDSDQPAGFRADADVPGPDGETIVRAGDVGWWDPLTERAYPSYELARIARENTGLLPVVDPDKALAADGATTTEARLDADIAESAEVADASGMIEVQAKAAALERMNIKVPEGRVLAITNGNLIRVLQPAQAAEGKGVADLLGKADPRDWAVGHVPAEFAKDRANAFAAFETPEDYALRVPPPRVKTVDAARFKLDAQDIAKLAPVGIDNQQVRTLLDLDNYLAGLQTTSWDQIDNLQEVDYLLQQLEAGLDVMARHAPSGLVRPVQDRKLAVEQARMLFEGSDPEVIAEAVRSVESLGGEDGPIFTDVYWGRKGEEAPSGAVNTNVDHRIPYANQVFLNTTSARVTEQGNLAGKLATHYHELAHWAYANILTPEDQLEFWQYVRKNFYDNVGELSPEAAMARLPPGTTFGRGIGGSPAEMFAEQFVAWVTSRDKSQVLGRASFWNRVKRYVKEIYNWFVNRKSVDPQLEPLFSKILPDERERIRAAAGGTVSLESLPKVASHAVRRSIELDQIATDLRAALATDSDSSLIESSRQLLSHLYSLNPKYTSKTQGDVNLPPFGPVWAAKVDIRNLRDKLANTFLEKGNQRVVANAPGATPEADRYLDRARGIIELIQLGVTGKRRGWKAQIGEEIQAMDLPVQLARQIDRIIASVNDGDMASVQINIRGFMDDVSEYSRMVFSNEDAVSVSEQFRLENIDGTSEVDGEVLGSALREFFEKETGGLARGTGLSGLVGDIQALYRQTLMDVGGPGAAKLPKVPASISGAKTLSELDPSGELMREHRRHYVQPAWAKQEGVVATATGQVRVKHKSDGRVISADKRLRDLSDAALIEQYERSVSQGENREADIISAVIVQRAKAMAEDPEFDAIFAKLPADLKEAAKAITVNQFESKLLDALAAGQTDFARALVGEFKRKPRRWASLDKKLPTVEFKDETVNAAKVAEESRMQRPNLDDGIPGGAPAGYQDVLRMLTSRRNGETELTMRTMGHRLLMLNESPMDEGIVTEANVATLAGSDYGPGIVTGFRSPAFQKFRGELLEANVGLNFDGDPENAMRIITEMTMRTRSLSPADRGVVADRGVDEVLGYMRGEVAADSLPEAVRGAYDRISERVAYVTNGQIGKADVLGRYPRLGMYGDMLRGTPAMPTAVRTDNLVSAGTEGRMQASLSSQMTEDRLSVVRGFVGTGIGVDRSGTPMVWYRHGNRLARSIDQLGNTVPADDYWGPMIQRQREIVRMAKDDGAASVAMRTLENMNVQARKAGVEFLDGAEPTYVGLRATLDLRPTKIYKADSAQINAIVAALSRIAGKPISGVEGRGLGVYNGLRAQASDAQILRAFEAAGFDSFQTTDVVEILGSGRDRVKPVWFSEFVDATPEPVERIPGEGRLSGSAITIAALSPDDVFDEAIDNVVHHVGAVADFHDNTVVASITRALKGKEVRPEDLVEVRNASKATMLMGSGSKRLKQDGANFLGQFVEDYFPAVHQKFAEYFLPIQNALDQLEPGQSAVRRALVKYGRGIVRPLVTNPNQPKSHGRILRALRRGQDSQEYRALSDAEKKAYQVIAERRNTVLQDLRESGVLVGDTRNYVPQVYDVVAIEKDTEGFVGALKQYFKDEWLQDGSIAEKVNPDGEADKLARQVVANLVEDNGVYIPGAGRSRTADDSHLAYQRIIRLQNNPEVMRRMEAGNFLLDDLEGLWIKYYDQAAKKLAQARTIGATGHGYDDYLYVAQRGVSGVRDMLTNSTSYRGFSGESGKAKTIPSPMPFAHNPAGLEQSIDELISQVNAGGAKAGQDYLMSLLDTGKMSPSARVSYETRMRAVANAVADMQITRDGGHTLSRDAYIHAEGVLAQVQGRNFSPAGEKFRKFSRGVRAFNNVSLLSFTTLTSMSDVVLPLIRSGDFKSWVKGIAKYTADPVYRRMIKNSGVAVENILHQRMQGMYAGDVRGMSGRVQQSFFAATLLTPWTDMMRGIAGAVGLEALDSQIQIAARSYRQGLAPQAQPPGWKRAKRILNSYGLGDFAMPSKFSEQLDAGDPKVAEALIRFANDTIYSPNPGDMPLWSQTPAGAIIAQLKTFPIMMQRAAFGSEGRGGVFRNAYRAGRGFLAEHSGGMFKAKPGDDAYTIKDALPAAYMLTVGPMFGALVLGSKDLVQGRGEEWGDVRSRNITKTFVGDVAGLDEQDTDDLYGWYIESMMALGGMGMLAEIMQDMAANADNGHFGLNRSMSALFGPSVGMAMDAMQVAGGAVSAGARAFGAPEANSQERAAVRALAARVPVLGGIRPVRDTTVDVVAGEAQTRGGGGLDLDF